MGGLGIWVEGLGHVLFYSLWKQLQRILLSVETQEYKIIIKRYRTFFFFKLSDTPKKPAWMNFHQIIAIKLIAMICWVHYIVPGQIIIAYVSANTLK